MQLILAVEEWKAEAHSEEGRHQSSSDGNSDSDGDGNSDGDSEAEGTKARIWKSRKKNISQLWDTFSQPMQDIITVAIQK